MGFFKRLSGVFKASPQHSQKAELVASPTSKITHDVKKLGAAKSLQHRLKVRERSTLSPHPVDQGGPIGVPLEGDTLIGGEETFIDELDHEDAIDTAAENEDDFGAADANEDTFVLSDDAYAVAGPQKYDVIANREEEIAQAMEMLQSGWTSEAVFLFQKLARRGFEPLLPQSWALDFLSFPADLFAGDEAKAFIKSEFASDFRGIKALRSLIDLGPRIRDALVSPSAQRGPEEIAHRGIQSYTRWAFSDGGVNSRADLPVLSIISGDVSVDATILQNEMLACLAKLDHRWHNALRVPSSDEEDELSQVDELIEEPPTLYGVIASHTIVAFVAYDCSGPIHFLRTIAMFDFGDSRYDVWNTLAIAILVVHCRNKMMEMQAVIKENTMNETYETGNQGLSVNDPDA